jgi:uncharacterized membrane protein
MSTYSISRTLWIIGLLLVLGAWVGILPRSMAQLGWEMMVCGLIVRVCFRPRIRHRIHHPHRERHARPYSVADEISKLNLLRQEGVITEEEFQSEKARLLGRE